MQRGDLLDLRFEGAQRVVEVLLPGEDLLPGQAELCRELGDGVMEAAYRGG
jgi:hypothetical protein